MFHSLVSYRASFLTHDLVAGLTLVAVAIPEQMATARLGRFSPEIGFFAFVWRPHWHSLCSEITASCLVALIRP
jgi:MFS superfamily sulfate permease-like transporter